MSLPFTAAQFFEILRAYNEGVWPAQLGLYAAALVALLLLATGFPRALSAVLALLWAWMGLAYHLAYFSAVNPAAYAFGAAFLVAAALFAWEGVVRGRLRFQLDWGARGAAGAVLVAYALAAYPLLALALGQRYPSMPTFGLPCPTTIFTIGLLGFLQPGAPARVFVVPALWTLIGAQAAFLFGVREDLALLAAGAAAVWFALPRHSRARFA